MTIDKRPIYADETAMLYGDPEPSPAAPTTHERPARADRYQARLKPLSERLREKLAQIPKEEQAKGLQMGTIWGLCSGVQRSKPPAHQVADALRELGWTRIRVYSDTTDPSGTFWFPPEFPAARVREARLRERGLA